MQTELAEQCNNFPFNMLTAILFILHVYSNTLSLFTICSEQSINTFWNKFFFLILLLCHYICLFLSSPPFCIPSLFLVFWVSFSIVYCCCCSRKDAYKFRCSNRHLISIRKTRINTTRTLCNIISRKMIQK